MMEKIVQLVRKENTWENAVYPYWVFENVINPETCEQIINLYIHYIYMHIYIYIYNYQNTHNL